MRRPPTLVVITAVDVVGEQELVARLERAADLLPQERARIAVQLRDPELGGLDLWRLGRRLREVTTRLDMALVVNDRLDLAIALGADGVHLGRGSVAPGDARALVGDGVWISVACHAPAECVAAGRAGADAATLSPIFASPGKGDPVGVEALHAARAALRAAGLELHVVALGGIDGADRAAACLRAGADGLAAIRADLLGCARAVFAGETRPR